MWGLRRTQVKKGYKKLSAKNWLQEHIVVKEWGVPLTDRSYNSLQLKILASVNMSYTYNSIVVYAYYSYYSPYRGVDPAKRE